MTKYRNGDTLGFWTLVFASYKGTNRYWLCECICGKEKEVSLANLTSGRSQSCGCIGFRIIADKKTTHGMAGTRPHKIWKNMLQRCNNPNNSSFSNYGGRGLTVCERWYSFENFWCDMEEGYRDDLTIERIDNNQGYYPENCTWIPHSAQASNKRPSSEWNYTASRYKVRMY